MKKFDGVLKRVRMLEEKNGISYAKPEGKLYKTLKVLYILVLLTQWQSIYFSFWECGLRLMQE